MIVIYKDIGNVYVQQQCFDFGISLERLIEENHDELDFIEKRRYQKYPAAYFYYNTEPINRLKILAKLAGLEIEEPNNILIVDYGNEKYPNAVIPKSLLEFISIP